MKRRDLIVHVEAYGCVFVREGASHTVYRNSVTGEWSTIPRHREIKDDLARKICRDLSVPSPR
ncbi:MAG: type II toxin-antitoxin system HicA family toxin [Thermoanaerobaculia bacterium]